MASTSSSTPSLTASRSPSPPPIVQPDHFYGSDHLYSPPPGKSWLDPNDDPACARGIPVFKPTMEEFRDFEAYMNKVECWGRKSGIIKVIPPKEWTESLPSIKPQLSNVKIKTPIEQHMLGRAGLFRQENMEKNRNMSVREWVELCRKPEHRAPAVDEVLHIRQVNMQKEPTKRRKTTVKPDPGTPIKDEPLDHVMIVDHDDSPIPRTEQNSTVDEKPAKRPPPTRADREARMANRLAQDEAFLDTFDPHTDWLPPNTTADDYTPEFCRELERRYWRNCGLGKPAWYGADTQGSLYTDETKAWNVAHLESTLSRLLEGQGLPGVNTPYLYWGMWRATFAWHVEDMDLFSINYIHFGAPKFWYAMPQARADALEGTMRSYFPKDTSKCSQFLRHKSFLVSPSLLSTSYCKPNCCVQQAGEFIITYPRGYHAGFNLGINCAESVNFALDSWIELGRKAEACQCIPDSVRINVDQLLRERGMEPEDPPPLSPKEEEIPVEQPLSPNRRMITKAKKEPTLVVPLPPKSPPKRKAPTGNEPQSKRPKVRPSVSLPFSLSSSSSGPKITLKIRSEEPYPCCLCISTAREGLLPVYDPPYARKDAVEAASHPEVWMAHESCARIIPETWVDEIDNEETGQKETFVFGVDGIVKDRWNLKCAACTRSRPKAHGAPIQCTKGKCSKSFHISCARNESTILFSVIREIEKEVLLLDTSVVPSKDSNSMAVDGATVLKVIRKDEIQCLCAQHNPDIAAAKRASKQDKIRTELLSLPPMARLKIRVSSGVFEVSLIRVIEENGSVEVLWDRGATREFKWGSVIFGATDGPVLQKPSEMPTLSSSSVPLNPPSFPSVSAATNITIPVLSFPPSSAVTPPFPSNLMVAHSPSATASSSSIPFSLSSHGYSLPSSQSSSDNKPDHYPHADYSIGRHLSSTLNARSNYYPNIPTEPSKPAETESKDLTYTQFFNSSTPNMTFTAEQVMEIIQNNEKLKKVYFGSNSA